MFNIKDSSINSFKTKILKKEVINGKIEPKTDPFYDRSIACSKFTSQQPLLQRFLQCYQGMTEEQSLHFYYNTLADKNGGILMPRELACKISQGKPLKPGSDFRSTSYLEDLKGKGILKEISKPIYSRGVAIEVRVKQSKAISQYVAELLCHFIETDLMDLLFQVQDAFMTRVSGLREYYEDSRDQRKCQNEADFLNTSPQRINDLTRSYHFIMDLKLEIRDGLTAAKLQSYVSDFIPGRQPERKCSTYTILVKMLLDRGYDIPDWQKGKLQLETQVVIVNLQRQQALKDAAVRINQQIQVAQQTQLTHSTLIEASQDPPEATQGIYYQQQGSDHFIDIPQHPPQLIYHRDQSTSDGSSTPTPSHTPASTQLIYGSLETGASPSPIYEVDQSTSYISPPVNPTHPPAPVSPPELMYEVDKSEAESMKSPEVSPPLDPLIYPKLRPTPLPEVTPSSYSPGSLRDLASDLLTANSASYVSVLNEALTYRLITYDAQDESDIRQRSHMISDGCLPFLYKTLSSVSPRVYGRGGDNLFYCRKEMRLHAMEGLGFMDVDLENCHVQIALSLWGKHLPFLKEEISKGSLWSSYEKRYKEANLPFYKSLIKSMHHATFLGGGRKARLKAWKSYNNHHPGKGIREDDFRAIEKVFTSSPIYKELKALFRRLSNKFHHKEITLPTGEKLIARRMTRKSAKRKKAGEKDDPGNMLTVIAAILQSIEVSIVSYMIVKTQHLYVPILWQHDGLTIKSLDPNIDVVGEMQKAVDEYCMHHLGRSMKLVGVPL